MLCLQCGAGVTADHIHEFWRRQRRQDTRDPEIRARDRGGIQYPVDGTKHADPECVYPVLHDAYAGGSGDSADHIPMLRTVFFAPAAQYLFDLLFPGADEAEDCFYRVGGKGTCDQRYPDLSASCGIYWKCDLVCYAGHGAYRCFTIQRNLRMEQRMCFCMDFSHIRYTAML